MIEVNLQQAYDEACKALGDSVVRERLLTAELTRLSAPLDNKED